MFFVAGIEQWAFYECWIFTDNRCRIGFVEVGFSGLAQFFPGGAADARHQRRLPHPAALRADLPDHRVSGKRHLPPDGRGARSVALSLSLFKSKMLNYTKEIHGTAGTSGAVLLVIYAVRQCC